MIQDSNPRLQVLSWPLDRSNSREPEETIEPSKVVDEALSFTDLDEAAERAKGPPDPIRAQIVQLWTRRTADPRVATEIRSWVDGRG